MLGGTTYSRLMCGAAALAIVASAGAAHAEDLALNIAPQPLTSALKEFGVKTGRSVLYGPALADAKVTQGVGEAPDAEAALGALLEGTGLSYRRNGDTFLIVQGGSGGPQSAGAGGDVDALIVTAQKREENIQDVPIAISAFSQEDLTRSQVAGGPDLITQVPNMTFTKTNFSSFSVQIRGIGTQAISATTDPAVAIAFNNTPFIRNRFFEQEFYDLQRLEVLRGPQGTLYGRNATAGVVNIISQKPRFIAEAKLSGDLSNYNSSRLEGMVNIPLVEDAVALRLAGAWTKRDGYGTNELTGNPIDGRDLWSTRLSLRLAPTDRLDVNLIWEHFEEDDDRLRSGKQLCKKHVVDQVGSVIIPPPSGDDNIGGAQATHSTGCERVSLYSPEAFQTVNGLSVPYYRPLANIGVPINVNLGDPYASTVQSRDLRVIESTIDPDYRAKADLGELQIAFDLTDELTLTSETAYSTDFVYSLQDFNRFNTLPGAWTPGHSALNENGEFCDPQLGCSDRLVAVDISTAKARQFSQEFRLGSDFEGPFNFSLGANFMRADSEDKYYVFINSLSLGAVVTPLGPTPPYVRGEVDNRGCLREGYWPEAYSPLEPGNYNCVYLDPNPIESLNDQGHNYFLSRNPFKLISYAVFGEAYYNITDTLKVTMGLRYSVDQKQAPRIPSWTFVGSTYGYPVTKMINQEWREPTGRLVVDWKPDLSFTDETLVYASYAHGYKAGGANPPPYIRSTFGAAAFNDPDSELRPQTFEAEFVDTYELGAKNTFADGRVTLNLAAFYYDYTGYQVSEIVDRSAFNRNFDTEVWGAEIEADWRPLENLRLGLKAGYAKTRIADGEEAIDLADRTAGDPDWIVVRPFPTRASSCVMPTEIYVLNGQWSNVSYIAGGQPGGCERAYEQGETLRGYDPTIDVGQHNGEGFVKPLGGNELPNAPNWTATLTGDYTIPLPNEWLATLHTDLHWQAESYWRVFQDHEFSKLDEYFTMNLAAIFTNEEAGWNIMAYIKNVTDETAITGAFLNSDDTGLTANVFLTEPRLYGLRVTKAWTGGPLLGSFGERRNGYYPFTVELGGQVQRWEALNEPIRPTFFDSLTPGIDSFGDAQDSDLDWGDGRNVRLTYRPEGSPWSVSAAVRYGKTNGGGRARAEQAFGPVCAVGLGYEDLYCDPESPYYRSKYLMFMNNFTNAVADQREGHQLVDFAVGRDIGIGGLSRSTISAGVRYAQFKSKTHLSADIVDDWYFTDGFAFPGGYYPQYYPITHTRYAVGLTANREFEGTGPMVSWEASQALFGNDDAGHIDLDWTVGGGVLFGKQDMSVAGTEKAYYYDDGPDVIVSRNQVRLPAYVAPPTYVDMARSRNVTVPVLSVSLGLSYKIDRFTIGTGYRWERYYNVLDGGYSAPQDADRTIDGPYFKIAVGFGG